MPEHHGDSAPDERAAQLLGDFGVEAGEHLLFQLDDRHLGAERAVEVSELESDRAGADNDDARRHLVEHQRLLGGNDAVANFHPRKQFLGGPSRNQNPLALERRHRRRRLAFDLAERHRMRPGNERVSLEEIDLVLAKQVKHALGKLVRRRPRPRNHFGEINPNLASFDAVLFRRPANRIHRAGRIKQRLGRNTPPIETNAPRPVPLDDSNAHLQLRRPNRRNVSARPRTNHHKVIPRICQDEVLPRVLNIIPRIKASSKSRSAVLDAGET